MLVIKIELWPGGHVSRAREIGRVFVNNTSDLDETSNYSVRADEMGAEHLGIPARSAQFEIKGHNRNQSVFALLAKVFTGASEDKKTSD